MNYAVARRYPKQRKPNSVLLDVDSFEVLGRASFEHWCHECKAMRRFALNEAKLNWNCETCGHTMILQQLIIEGLISESKYRGIERC